MFLQYKSVEPYLSLADINVDGIPELIYYDGDAISYAHKVSVFTIKNDRVIKLYDTMWLTDSNVNNRRTFLVKNKYSGKNEWMLLGGRGSFKFHSVYTIDGNVYLGLLPI